MNKKFTKLIAAFALLVFMMPSLAGWGQSKTETTTTYTFTSKSWEANISGTSANWTSGAEGSGFSNNGIQVTGSASANGTSPTSFDNITKIVATYNTNKSQGAGTLKIKIGDNSEVSQSIGYSGSGDGRTANYTSQFDYATAQSGSVKVTVEGSTNSIYLVSVAITTTTGGTGTATTTTIDPSGITNTNKYLGTDAGSLSASVTYGSPATAVPNATVSWSGNNDAVATINASTGAVTLVAAGSVTFRATYAGDATYNASFAEYVMTVTNENPNLTTIWSENFSNYSANDVPNGGTYSYSCVNGGSNTKIFDEQLAEGDKPELLVGKSGGSFTATIPLLTSTHGYSGNLTLTYKTNANALNVKTTTTGLSVDGEASTGAGVSFSTKETHTVTFKGVTTSTENITIVFTAGSSNVRLDNIVLKGEQAPLTKVATPQLDPAGGAVANGTQVTITCPTAGATIYYTMGTTPADPTSSSTPYNPANKPTITENTTIKAIAIKADLDNSTVASASYTIAEPCATPTFDPAAGMVDKGTTVSISTETAGATIYYTTDGSVPTTSSTVYSSAITVNSGMTIKAMAVKEGNSNSPVASATYTVRDYATLPFVWDNTTTPTGITTTNTGGFYPSSPYIKLNQAGTGVVILKLNAAPGLIAFDIKGNPSSGTTSTGTFTVATSANGTDYTTLASYTSITNKTQTLYFMNLNDDTRYIKWSYEKGSGNVALGNFNISIEANQSTTWTAGEFTPVSNQIYVVNSGATLVLDGDYSATLNNSNNLIIEDGGQLITHNAVQATVKKNVTAASTWGSETPENKPDGWYFIASPVDGASYSTAMTTGTGEGYDLYMLDWTNNKWLNKKNSDNDSAFGDGFARGTGYLYASQAGNTLSVSGAIQPLSNDDNATVILANDGWNLIGNPLTCKVTVSTAFSELTNAPTVTSRASNSTINPFQGIAVWGKEGDEVTFTKVAAQNATAPGNALQMTVTQNIDTRGNATSTTVDNAVISFSESSVLPKFNMLEGNANLYIPQGTEEYAIVSSNGQGEMPVNFRANANGQYTLTVNPEGVELSYLHLIDNMTGADVDLLATPSYTFNAKTTDYENRFKLVFVSSICGDANGDNETFAFFSNGSWVIANEGQATLQVVDITGRIISSEVINGTCSKAVNATPGVYVLRLINGDSVKSQKIVVR